jgi:hypothetical protein
LFSALAACVLLPSIASGQKVIPLPDEYAKDLELLGEGVIGKAIPAPNIEDATAYYMGGPGGGEWTYKVLKGEKEQLRSEKITPAKDESGKPIWKEEIGDQFIQYMRLNAKGDLGKYREDDLELSYLSAFDPGIYLTGKTKVGTSLKFSSKISASKLSHPDKVSYSGKMDTTMTYIGAYEVKTPAGTYPAILMRAEFDIKIGPAKVVDVQYSFYSRGVGRIAEVESLKVSALLIYHSNEKTAKILAEKPKLVSK